MANLIATREALERFCHELPQAGIVADRLRRNASTTKSMIDQCLSIERASTEWIDHNLAVVVSDGLEEPSVRKSAQVLFKGIRRRFATALTHDPEDLALALALALGARGALDDERTAADIALICVALDKPQAGPRLLRSAVALIIASSQTKEPANQAALENALPVVEKAIERLGSTLPHHPEHGLHRIELAILAARRSEGTDRRAMLEQAHAQVKDYASTFGETAAVQRAQVTILEQLARSEGASPDVGQDAWDLLNTALRGENLKPKKALRLLRTLNRSGFLGTDRASSLIPRLEAFVGERRKGWGEIFGLLMEASGNESGLMTLWEKSLREDPRNKAAAKGLSERLVSNLRQGLKAPFDLATLGAVLDVVPPGTMARWSAGDINNILSLTKEGFGPQRALGFLTERVLRVKEHKKRASLWDTSLGLAKEIGGDSYLDVARLAMDVGKHQVARLEVASFLSRSEAHLEEALEVLRPLLDVKGGVGAKAQELHRKISKSPALRGSKRDALVAFEEAIGVGTPKSFELRVAHTGQNYVLAELNERPAPRFYDHKFLRVMIKASELPRDLPFAALKKGDIFKAPVRGQDADPKKDKNPRLYWIADPSALSTDLTVDGLNDRLRALETKFGVGSGETVRVKVGFDPKRKTLTARLFGTKGKAEFPLRPELKEDNLPEGTKVESLGRGKRAWGVVDVEEGKSGRRYVVRGTLSFEEPGSDAAQAPPEVEAAEVKETAAPPDSEGAGSVDEPPSAGVETDASEDSKPTPEAE